MQTSKTSSCQIEPKMLAFQYLYSSTNSLFVIYNYQNEYRHNVQYDKINSQH